MARASVIRGQQFKHPTFHGRAADRSARRLFKSPMTERSCIFMAVLLQPLKPEAEPVLDGNLEVHGILTLARSPPHPAPHPLGTPFSHPPLHSTAPPPPRGDPPPR